MDPARQIESFLVQMSIRIYWMERMTGGDADEAGVTTAARAEEHGKADLAGIEKAGHGWSESGRWSCRWVWPDAVLAGLSASTGFQSRARYRFPDLEVEPRLGGAHAAGVGAVISFASATVPPASQRDQVPDYLRRA